MANPIPLVVNDDSGAPAGAIPVDIYGVDSGGAVDSVNGQTGTVVLAAADVGAAPAGDYASGAQGAKADTAVQPEDLADVATSGKYSDLIDPPTIPTPLVDSVNGQTGAVTLDASDVGAQPAGSYATQSALNDLIQRVEDLENAGA